MGGGETATTKRCGFWEFTLFILAVITGTACSICSKTMMELHGIGIDGDVEVFSKPLFQTFGMFVGMLFGLVMHEVVLYFKIPFPGYNHDPAETNQKNKPPVYGSIDETRGLLDSSVPPQVGPTTAGHTPMWLLLFLAIPSIFDLAATALCMMGLRYLDVSIYQLLRGSGIIFVALMKQHVSGFLEITWSLKQCAYSGRRHHTCISTIETHTLVIYTLLQQVFNDRLYNFQWLGVFWNVIAVILVGMTAILSSNDNENVEPGEALLGVFLVMLGALTQAMQYVFEEKVLTMEEADVPPLLLIGMEGFWGTFLCLVLLYPLAYYLPGDDHGSFEDPFNTYAMVVNTPTIQWAFVIYFFAIFGYNLFAVLVTFLLNSIWHAILDNFRPISVWLADLAIFYVFTEGDFGEPWTPYSYIQLFGMVVLLYGTAIYNAPHAGSIKMLGQWYVFGINLRHEYEAVHAELEEARLHEEWEERKAEFAKKRHSSLAERLPLPLQ